MGCVLCCFSSAPKSLVMALSANTKYFASAKAPPIQRCFGFLWECTRRKNRNELLLARKTLGRVLETGVDYRCGLLPLTGHLAENQTA